MTLLLAYALVLLLAVLLSALAGRTVLSTAVVFLVAGFILGDGVTDVITVAPEDPLVSTLVQLAMFAVLYTDGMRVKWREVLSAWRLPVRALALGLPLALLFTAILAHYLVGLGWTESLLLAAVLAPTDPVFAAALVGNDNVPRPLRHLLNVESGANDGLALPFVIVFLEIAEQEPVELGELASEVVLGLVIGIGVPLVVIKLEQSRIFGVAVGYRAVNAAAIALLVFALNDVVNGNHFLAAFAAGITVATLGQPEKEAFHESGELASELLKLAALLLLGVLISPEFLDDLPWTGWVFGVLALVVARPAALYLSFLGSGLGRREQAVAMWFGPRGFGSVVYGLLVLSSGIPAAAEIFHLAALTITMSIIAHSSTDLVVARQFDPERYR